MGDIEILGKYKTKDGHIALVDRIYTGKLHGRIFLEGEEGRALVMLWGIDFKAWGSEHWDLMEKVNGNSTQSTESGS